MNRSSPRRSDGLYACVTSRGCVQTTRLTLLALLIMTSRCTTALLPSGVWGSHGICQLKSPPSFVSYQMKKNLVCNRKSLLLGPDPNATMLAL